PDDMPVTDDLNEGALGVENHGGGRDRKPARARGVDGAARERADAQPWVAAEEDAHAAEPRRLVDLRRDETHGPSHVAQAAAIDLGFLAGAHLGEFGFDDLGIELDLTAEDNAEQGLRHAGRHAADPRGAPADETVGRRGDLGIVAAPLQLAALGLDLLLL